MGYFHIFKILNRCFCCSLKLSWRRAAGSNTNEESDFEAASRVTNERFERLEFCVLRRWADCSANWRERSCLLVRSYPSFFKGRKLMYSRQIYEAEKLARGIDVCFSTWEFLHIFVHSIDPFFPEVVILNKSWLGVFKQHLSRVKWTQQNHTFPRLK